MTIKEQLKALSKEMEAPSSEGKLYNLLKTLIKDLNEIDGVPVDTWDCLTDEERAIVLMSFAAYAISEMDD